MGYHTKFKLVQPLNAEIINHFRQVCRSAEYCLDAFGDSAQEDKWYDHEEDLKEFSKNYPQVLFVLNGKGEECGDIWKLYVKNGKAKELRAMIVFPDFEEGDLT